MERLRAQLQKTRAQLAHTVAELKGAKTKLASAQLQVKASQTQVTQLQGTLSQTNATLLQTTAMLTQTQAALASSQARAASLQAKLDAIPTPIAVAEEQVRREVYWAEHVDDANPDGKLVAISAMSYVVGHVSTGAYGYLELVGGTLPTSNPESILGTQAGICGNAAIAFAAIVRHFGYSVRAVQFYYSTPDGIPDTHIAAEVFYDGAWHYFDPTFGAFWTGGDGHVLSIDEARSGGGTGHRDLAAFTNVVEDPWFAGDDTAFVADPATSVVIDGTPI
jgi:transglutaminase-like putative cysteine protease